MNTINEDLQFIRDHQAGVRTAPTYWTGWNSLAHRLAAEVERLRQFERLFIDSIPLAESDREARIQRDSYNTWAVELSGKLGMKIDGLSGDICEQYKELRNRISLEVERLRAENQQLREGLSLVAKNIGNGAFASPDASLDWLTKEVPAEVKLYCQRLRDELANSARALSLIAAGPRADGTYNRCREACEILAKQALTPPAK